MYETIKADTAQLRNEQEAIIRFFKEQIDAFANMKKTIEKVQWADSKYDELIVCMNGIGAAISNLIQVLTNGRDVYILSEFMNLLDQYTNLANSFPTVE